MQFFKKFEAWEVVQKHISQLGCSTMNIGHHKWTRVFETKNGEYRDGIKGKEHITTTTGEQFAHEQEEKLYMIN